MPGIDDKVETPQNPAVPTGDQAYFAQLLDEFSAPEPEKGNPPATPPAIEEPTPTPPVDPEPEPEPEPEEPEEEVATPKETPESKQAAAFAELRVRAAKYENAMKAAAEKEGLTLEAYMTKLDDDILKAKAAKLQVDPEIMRRLDSLEQENQRYRDLQIQSHIQLEYGKIRTELGADDKDLRGFTDTLIKKGHNFDDMTTDYVTLFRGMNYDKLVERERQKWITRDSKGQQATPGALPNGRREAPKEEEITSMSDLNALLDNLKI